MHGIASEKLTNIVKFAKQETAKKLLLTEDSFTKSWSQFDIDSRLGKQKGTKEELLDLIANQARSWTKIEIKRITSILKTIDQYIIKNGYSIPFPERILFVKTTGIEEGGAVGYTRNNYVVLKENFSEAPDDQFAHLVLHELFHVISRNNHALRIALYNVIGFKMMEPIEYPEKIKAFRITNPDATQTDCYITVEVNSKKIDCMMVLYSKRQYDGGKFFDYLTIGFLKLLDGERKEPELINGNPIIYEFNGVKNFYEQVGKNTNYIIHAEEIMAENFTMAVNGKTGLPNQEIIDQIKMILTKSE